MTYRIEIKDSAVEANGRVADHVAAEGAFHTFESRAAAEAFAKQLSRNDSRVRVQAVAPQDPRPVDGYLIRFPRRYHGEPKDAKTRGLTFDVDANQYGEVGRALVYGSYGLSPGLRYAVEAAVEAIDRGTHRLDGVPEPTLPESIAGQVTWAPDLLIRAVRRDTDQLDGQYFCEIKTGEASFQRGQLDAMHAVARTVDVLKIRVDISGLPAEYTVRVEVVS